MTARSAHARKLLSPAYMTRLILVLFACLALLSGWLSIEGLPRGVSAGPANGEFMAAPAHVSPVPCMSYAPYRRKGDAPWHASRPIRPEQIREDLRLLMPLTRCIRTYGVEHGLEAVPAVARELGFKVRLGVWIGGDRTGNQAHLEQAIALAREYHDVVDLLVVGNEVLLRGELPLHELTGLLDQARAAQPAPVAYADVWEFWQRHASELKSHVDVAAIHILPYWEDHPVGIDHALAHVKAVRHSMQRELAPLPVWLAETGWPSAGRQRGAARPGLTEQARFVRQWAQEARPDDNLIEAFDQPWKRDLEGAMGGHWGMLDAQGRAKFAWTGALPAAIALEPALAALLTGALLGGILGFYLATSTRLNPVEANQIEQVAPTDCAGKTEPTQKQAIFAFAGGLAGACRAAHPGADRDDPDLGPNSDRNRCRLGLCTAVPARCRPGFVSEHGGPRRAPPAGLHDVALAVDRRAGIGPGARRSLQTAGVASADRPLGCFSAAHGATVLPCRTLDAASLCSARNPIHRAARGQLVPDLQRFADSSGRLGQYAGALLRARLGAARAGGSASIADGGQARPCGSCGKHADDGAMQSGAGVTASSQARTSRQDVSSIQSRASLKGGGLQKT